MPLSTRPSIIRDHCPCSRGVEEPMKRFVVRRVGYALLSLVMLSATIFVFVRLTGDPSVLLVEPGASKADIDAIRADLDRKSTRLNSSHRCISYAVFCLKKKTQLTD